MFVNKSIVEKWYQTDSWVYKNFAYLFENPLWSKNNQVKIKYLLECK
jgi:hypothetical protein